MVAADIAVYAEGAARPTGGCGSVAMLVGRNAPLRFDLRAKTTHAVHVSSAVCMCVCMYVHVYMYVCIRLINSIIFLLNTDDITYAFKTLCIYVCIYMVCMYICVCMYAKIL